MNKLRAFLRSETSEAHSRLDSALVAYDLKSPAGLQSYLSIHHLARVWLGLTSNRANELIDNPKKITEIEHDLSTLGAIPPRHTLYETFRIHPLALTYVVAGSSLGSKLLYKEWRRSENETVRRAGLFLTSSKDSTEWATFLEKTDTLQISQNEMEDVVTSANNVFAIYEAANNKIKRDLHDRAK